MAIRAQVVEPVAHPTRERLMEAAERLFAASDYEDVSVRAINAAAGANAAAVHYHFGSKEALVAAILERRMVPLNEWRRARYGELVAGGRRPSSREVVDLLVRPLFDLMRDEPSSGPVYVQLLSRLYLRRDPLVISRAPATEPMWSELMALACPDLAPERARLRWLFVVDAAMVTLSRRFAAADRHPGPGLPWEVPDLPWEVQAEELIDFLAEGCGGRRPERSATTNEHTSDDHQGER